MTDMEKKTSKPITNKKEKIKSTAAHVWRRETKTFLKSLYTSIFLNSFHVWKLKHDPQCFFNKGYLTTEGKEGDSGNNIACKPKVFNWISSWTLHFESQPNLAFPCFCITVSSKRAKTCRIGPNLTPNIHTGPKYIPITRSAGHHARNSTQLHRRLQENSLRFLHPC